MTVLCVPKIRHSGRSRAGCSSSSESRRSSQPEASDDRQIERVADTDQIRTALRRLPREQATAVVLATIYGLSTREIAEHQRVPLGTAKTRIRLGLARLRDHVDVSAA